MTAQDGRRHRLGIHSLVWVGAWSPEEARHAVSSSAEAGFDLVELAALDPWAFDTDLTARLLEEHGLAAGVSLGLGEDTDVSSEDPERVAAGRRLLSQAADLVRDVGGDYLGGVVFSRLGRYDAPVTERGRAHSVESIATNVLNTTAQTLQFIEDVGRDNVVAHLDTYHMNIEETSFREPVLAAAAAGRLGYVHVGESHRGQLGTGSVPWREFFDALDEVGYDGTITFESFSSRVVHPTLSSNLAIWRDPWTDSVELARGARSFLAEHLGH